MDLGQRASNRADLATRAAMAQVEIYTTRFCGFCHSAKALLARKGIKFLEIDVSGDPQKRSEMIERANGRTTVPQIFVGSTHNWRLRRSVCAASVGRARPAARRRRHHTRGIRMSTHMSTPAT